MIEEQTQQGILQWFKGSIVVKLAFIAFLTLVLLIPSVWVDGLITERSARQNEIISDVSDKWSGPQQIKGPVLIIPYKKQVRTKDASQKEVITEVTDNLYILPNDLKINSDIRSSKLHRGIFDVIVYNTLVKVTGNFVKADLAKLSIDPAQLMPAKAHLAFSITDLKGLKTNPVIKLNGQSLSAEPIFSRGSAFESGLQVAVALPDAVPDQIPFDFTLDLKGSQDLSFLALGKTTEVTATGDWAAPSFDGRSLPNQRNVTATGFNAHWKMLYYNRPFPQEWTGNDNLLANVSKLEQASFGVKLRVPVDQYQKTTRTSKYSALIILLTFISLFLTEVIRRHRIHIFNYLLIGAAMIVFYTLLLSFSEHIGYNYAYLVAAVATIGLISSFMASLFKDGKAAAMFAAILSLFYGFIFVIIQLEDLSLMVGSIALFIIVATLMYFSRKINWDQH
ncbi:cell envelope integrity protein CreD [Mucilaginibacter myungsuensis]|uniref:Cell envelope integrity protein CreD n=1 Tax=Mucilaginibacter myungsuensis TaxID=649104 RepID=A0A929PVX0_9SPHI|nr:cell envelope integrity protein CreD [Mucilaginibacter myungsuensis]MBE9662223.1 cell envelope integrity protein CreD [Mucilaginibacter myungsuensis]MDN3599341.1 cell envelope integrity protein CreD [Mucilaginibacter myungsuensis]